MRWNSIIMLVAAAGWLTLACDDGADGDGDADIDGDVDSDVDSDPDVDGYVDVDTDGDADGDTAADGDARSDAEADSGGDCPGGGGPSMVWLPDGYCIDTTEVTRAQYAAWLAAGPNEVAGPFCDPAARDPDQGHGAGAVPLGIGGLEVDGDEGGQHAATVAVHGDVVPGRKGEWTGGGGTLRGASPGPGMSP